MARVESSQQLRARHWPLHLIAELLHQDSLEAMGRTFDKPTEIIFDTKPTCFTMETFIVANAFLVLGFHPREGEVDGESLKRTSSLASSTGHWAFRELGSDTGWAVCFRGQDLDA